MKVLTLTQPWSTLVAVGAKKIETRSWSTNYRGPLAIHAAKGFPDWAREFAESDAVREALAGSADLAMRWGGLFPTGKILGRVCLSDCRSADEPSDWDGVILPPLPGTFERMAGDYSAGRFLWLTRFPVPFDVPVPWPGRQRLWDWEGEA